MKIMLSAGSVIYSYDLDGFLAVKTDGPDITTYGYQPVESFLA